MEKDRFGRYDSVLSDSRLAREQTAEVLARFGRTLGSSKGVIRIRGLFRRGNKPVRR